MSLFHSTVTLRDTYITIGLTQLSAEVESE